MMVSTGMMTAAEFRALAEFRYQIRIFLNGSEEAARNADLEPQQYLRRPSAGCRSAASRAYGRLPSACSCATTASWVELVDRLERRQLLRRERSRTDRRQVILHLTPRGEKYFRGSPSSGFRSSARPRRRWSAHSRR